MASFITIVTGFFVLVIGWYFIKLLLYLFFYILEVIIDFFSTKKETKICHPIYEKKIVVPQSPPIEKPKEDEKTTNDILPEDIIDENIIFTGKGIYQKKKEWDGVKWTIKHQQIYVFKRDYHLNDLGKPRFHICKCSTMDEYIKNRNLEIKYRKSKSSVVQVRNMDNNNLETEIRHLPLCKNCYKIMKQQYNWLDSKTDNEEFVRKVIDKVDWQWQATMSYLKN